ncbi:OB-fold domain-containing protein [Mycolicibacter sp. MYC340]|uniref:OB-fold domain-containing protein n=1 Tax=[Mycobacterium] nativiensis TaxID=2855503 RepID=A0ABU5XTH1_9MYCO|nr:OB-fold domain-containing protein [Mycolicibacter sp. MYC340]MEB3031225.1 OB-fold domain-containing protein [Mycolicibacter sp. MYC340]
MLPELDEVSAPYWTGGAVGELRIAHCGSCRSYLHPPRGACPDCDAALEFRTVSGNGTLFTFTVNYQQFHPDVPTPFVIALVELDEQPGLRVATNIVDCDPAAVVSGMPVRVRFEEHGEVFVPVFAPARPLT